MIDPTRVVNPILMLVGEAPGAEEERTGVFFVGDAGKELTNYLDRAGIPRDRVYITNVLKCRPPDNRDPHVDEIDACMNHLIQELEEVRPRYIAAVGRFASRVLTGLDVDMEQVHGMPIRVTKWGFPTTVVPVYHPAAGLHDTFNMAAIMADFLALKQVMMGSLLPRPESLPGVYALWEGPSSPVSPGIVAVDTETEEGGKGWCLQVCDTPGMAWVIMRENAHLVKDVLEHPDTTVIMQNALFDLPVLWEMGIHPKQYVDTMVMAYLLQTEPQGLKALSYRHLGMKMREYSEVVWPASQAKALAYMTAAMEVEWPDPDPILKMAKGEPKVRKPQNVARRIKGVLNAYGKDESVDLYSRWQKIREDAGKLVELVHGPLLPGYLKDLPLQTAIDYAGCDADATRQIYPILDSKIRAMGLSETLDRDMRMLPLVAAMQANGFLIDVDKFRELSILFQGNMDKLQAEVEKVAGPVNIGSAPQLAELLYRLRLKRSPKLKKGDTDVAALETIAHRHPVIEKIIDWKRYDKLKASFIDRLPEMVGEDGRIRTTLRVTRVVTGRLSSSKPNLLAQPVRTADGRRIREGFIAEEGFSLVSNDYSQIEMRGVAHMSQDPVMLDIFRTNKDIHTETASRMFGIPSDQVDEMAHRYPAKRVGFGILNLISAGKLLREMEVGGAKGWTEQKCQKMIYDWFTVYRGVHSWIEGIKSEARRTGLVRDMFGRMRLAPELLSVHRRVVEAGIRQSVNAPIQMSAQGIIKEAMGQLVPILGEFGLGTIRPLLQVHDDLIFECRDDLIEVIVPIIRYVMENCVELSVPLRVDTKVGKSWGDMSKWKPTAAGR
jgi:uracil-DNA glycosylase family 4